MLRKKNCIVVALTFATFAHFFFCSNDRSSEKYKDMITHPRYGGTLVVGMAGDVDSFNPLFGESGTAKAITHLLMLGLADLNEQSEFTPEIASSWEHSDDYLKLTYHLRTDAVWSDGTPITAYDVQFTFDLLRDSTVASPNRWVTDYIRQVDVVDSHTVTFIFTEAYPDQLFDTAGEFLPKHVVEKISRTAIRSHQVGRNPLSSGPFLLKKWESQQFIELIPNDKYFGGRPYLDRVIFKIVPDATNLLVQLKTGEIDMIDAVPPKDAIALKKNNPEIDIYTVPGRIYYYIGYNEKNNLFASAHIRRAFTMAIDRQLIIKALLYGYGTSCTGPIPPSISWAFHEAIKEIPFSPEQARQTLQNEGWKDTDGDGYANKNGQAFKFVLKTTTGNQTKSDLAVILQDQFKKIGVKVEIQTVEWTAFLDQLREKDFAAYIGSWSTAFNVDPTPIFHSSATELFNYISYANPEIDKLIDAGRTEMDRKKAAQIWRQFQEVLYDDQPYSFLFWVDNTVAVHSRFKNVSPIPLSIFYKMDKWYDASVKSE